MKIQAIETAGRIYQQIQDIDEELKAINKAAEHLAGEASNISVVINFRIPKPDPGRVQFDQDGSIMFARPIKFMHIPFSPVWGSAPKEDEEPTDNGIRSMKLVDNGISDTTALRILGVLIAEKQEERAVLVARLERMGFTL